MVMRDRRVDRVPARVGGLAMLAGALGALVKALYLMVVSAIQGDGFWTVPNLSGAFYTSRMQIPTTFDAGASIVGVIMHLLTGALYGLAFGAVIAYFAPRALRTNGRAVVSGLIFGLVAYLVSMAVGPVVNYLTPQVNGMLGMIHPLIGHLLFGVVTALAFRAYTRRAEYSVIFHREHAMVTDRDHVFR